MAAHGPRSRPAAARCCTHPRLWPEYHPELLRDVLPRSGRLSPRGSQPAKDAPARQLLGRTGAEPRRPETRVRARRASRAACAARRGQGRSSSAARTSPAISASELVGSDESSARCRSLRSRRASRIRTHAPFPLRSACAAPTPLRIDGQERRAQTRLHRKIERLGHRRW